MKMNLPLCDMGDCQWYADNNCTATEIGRTRCPYLYRTSLAPGEVSCEEQITPFEKKNGHIGRLTTRDGNGCAYYQIDCRFEGKVAERLANYEDTGLTPDEVTILKNHVKLLERERQECSECEAVDNLKARLWDVTHKDWIPVSYGPPEPYEVILITAKRDDDEKPRTYQGAYQGSGNWKLFGVAHPDDYKIIAWMPSPEPYREG